MQGAYHNRPFADDEPGFAIEDDIPTDRAPDFHEQSMIPSHSDAEESLFHSCDDLEHENSDDFDPNVWASQDKDHEPSEQLPQPIEAFEEEDEDEEEGGAPFVGTVTQGTSRKPRQGSCRIHCHDCEERFSSNNQLHKHIRTRHAYAPVYTTVVLDSDKVDNPKAKAQSSRQPDKAAIAKSIRIIKSTAPPPVDGTTSVRNWYELKLTVKAARDGTNLTICPDTGAAITLADENFVRDNFPSAKWESLEEPVRYMGAGPGSLTTRQIAYITLYVPSTTDSGERVFSLWRIRAYITPQLGPNILLGMDTLVPQGVIIDIGGRTMRQPLCEGVVAPIIVKPKDGAARKSRKLTLHSTVVIPPNSAMKVKVTSSQPLSPNFDYILQVDKELPYPARPYAMLLNAQNMEAVIRNDTRNPVKVQRHAPLGLAVPLEVDGVFSLGPEDHSLAAMPDFENMAGPETKTASGITVYGDPVKVAALLAVANSYPDI